MAYRRTRIAPTPSGFLHLGNLFSFLLTANLAKKEKAVLQLRLDDMDQQRTKPEFVEDIFDSLDFIGITCQEGPKNLKDFESNYSQTKRLSLYTRFLDRLVSTGKVFACTCSRSEVQHSGSIAYTGTCRNKNIPLDTKDACWRLDTSGAKNIPMQQYKAGCEKYTLPETMRDFVIKKKDGFPSYQVCSVADDLYFEVDLIVRGKDLWESSLAQLYLAQLIGEQQFLECAFVHHTLLLGDGGKKLSKSAGDTSIHHLRNKGYSRKEILTLIQNLNGEIIFSI